ncbi:MAG TPA: BadF/BadG/BcrA/BcrD ATPase family protein [Longimicrobium sp.]|nr:BadF/BadG/BcrA/BcrD ATPase family protein [Longimicrobium sp.]
MADAVLYAGVDGGGTRTTLVLATADGREVARRVGPAGLVDPRHPTASAEVVAELVRDALAEIGGGARVVALCAGLAGVGNETERMAVEEALAASGVAGRVRIVTDGQIALEGALGGGAGVLMIAGTGSVAYARSEDGRVARCGGWGMMVGDEGSGYSLGRSALSAALRASDGRDPDTRLLPDLLEAIGVDDVREVPPWVGRADKSEVAALSRVVTAAAAAGDEVANGILRREAGEVALHARSLAVQLDPWTAPVAIVFYGGVMSSPLYTELVREALGGGPHEFRVQSPVSDAVIGALSFARQMRG